MIKIRIIALTLISLIIFNSCNSNQNNSKSNNIETEIKQIIDTVVVNNVNSVVEKKKSDDRYPKVLTYTDIIEKNEFLMEVYEETKEYSVDTISKKVRMNQYFFSYLTTQLKYMLRPELRLLRNEFFARKGYKFKSKDLSEYFSEYYWYEANIENANDIELSALEKNIIDTIKVYENRNKYLDAKMLKKEFIDYCKSHVKKEYNEYLIEIPSILFRRNLGYQIKGLPDHNKYWFNGEFLTVKIIDTLKNKNLLFGLFGQIMCPAEYCIWGGEIVTCDSVLNYLDSKSVEFETIDKYENAKNKYYKFWGPNLNVKTIIRINSEGKIIIE